MPTYTNPLEGLRVAAPCKADWEKMVGDERARYCNQCSLHVYNLSGMTRREAEALITSTEGRLCVRYYRRADGTVLTRNCPVGLSALKRRAARAATATLTAVLGFFTGLGLNFGVERAVSPEMMEESAVPAPFIPEVDASGRYAAPTDEPREMHVMGMRVIDRSVPDGHR
ncbi:MAG: hypothetical protein JOZ96_16705 [Acidobacteria bacterium]|nr:hypothetical protein [Acidobacteriota bacterium]